MLFKAIVLICASTVSQPDCQRDTARDVVRLRADLTMQQCFLQGQAVIADSGIKLGPDTYAKVMCRSAGLETVGATP